MAKGRRGERVEEEEAVRPYNEQVDYEMSDNEQSQEKFIPEETEVQVPLIMSEVTTPRRKKSTRHILKNKPKKRTLAARRINRLVSTVETLINRREKEQAINVVIERSHVQEFTLSRDDLRNRLNHTRQKKGKNQPIRGSTRERIQVNGRQERAQTSHHVSTSRAPSIHSRHNDSKRDGISSKRYRRE